MKTFKILALLASLMIVADAFSQQSEFPRDWVGNWKGELQWFRAQEEPRKVIMELRIQPVRDSANLFTWNLIYGTPTKDNRPYLLRLSDSTKGRWVIDEVNGIVLDQYLIGNKFSGAFSVGNSVIVNSYWIVGDELHVEFLSYRKQPVSTTGRGTEESPTVESFQITSSQKAVLRRN